LKLGCEVEEFDDAVRVVIQQAIASYPGNYFTVSWLSTDNAAQMSVLLALAEGTSTVTESIFENRFKYVDELTRTDNYASFVAYLPDIFFGYDNAF